MPQLKFLKAIPLLFAILLVSSCTRLQDFPVTCEFTGITSSLEQKECVNLFFIHGLGGYSKGDPDILINNIIGKLGLYENNCPSVREIVDNVNGCPKSYGFLTRKDYSGYCCPYNLRVYILDWRNATQPEKCWVNYIDAWHTNLRLPFTHKMKKSVINNDLADALLYASEYRTEIQYPVAQSIHWIHEDNEGCCSDTMVIGFSFGAAIVIDTLDSMERMNDSCNRNAAREFTKNISNVFMLSNTLPLFELARANRPTSHKYLCHKQAHNVCEAREPEQCNCPPAWQWQRSTLGRFVYKKRHTHPNFQVVAFTDPNDPLSYVVNDFYVPSQCGWQNAFINQLVRNSKNALMGMINPVDAHGGYGKNQKVADMIIYGVQNCYNYHPICNDLAIEFP
jgi:hypothetical protein